MKGLVVKTLLEFLVVVFPSILVYMLLVATMNADGTHPEILSQFHPLIATFVLCGAGFGLCMGWLQGIYKRQRGY